MKVIKWDLLEIADELVSVNFSSDFDYLSYQPGAHCLLNGSTMCPKKTLTV